eukprot:CAMPEP_0170456070 /NCGR_PEP_ID=MMETSP0123-20130129/3829_1 /TAXON_ID=182087 /ORGANISM="Favella ehrenbergii, Strain Fehren 1" /LENGTH=196 /DNA_ID=CAMNT_0010719429 /DNA_START=365 /DNA_END=955 /DNA_ORIENTATION=+
MGDDKPARRRRSRPNTALQPPTPGGRSKPYLFDQKEAVAQKEEEGIKDGDYVYSVGWQGVYWKGGLIVDMDEEWDKEAKEKVYGPDEGWRNESIAGSCIVKCRKVSGTTYFSKGVLHELGMFIKERSDVNVVYVNTTLTSMQQKKLEKRWNDILSENDDRMRQYFLKSANKGEYSPTEMETDTEVSSLETTSLDWE